MKIMEKLEKLVKKIYSWMQQHYLTFRFLTWLKEKGITRKINGVFIRKTDKRNSKDMKESQDFFTQNQDRVQRVLELLSDEKSKKVLNAVIKYRMYKTPIPQSLYSEYDQYFVSDIIRISQGEVFVDVGAYTGDTIQQFMDLARKQKVRYGKIIGFEPDEKNYSLVSRYYGKKKGVILIKKGISIKEDTLFFRVESATSHVVEDGNNADYSIPVTNIDSVKVCSKATWIKMDIEGAEMDALHGAEETIKRNHPKLTICIYHSDEDILRIIEYIHELVPEYRLYVRHHSSNHVETVLYAI
jgi:FkbM family methyltransferase